MHGNGPIIHLCKYLFIFNVLYLNQRGSRFASIVLLSHLTDGQVRMVYEVDEPRAGMSVSRKVSGYSLRNLGIAGRWGRSDQWYARRRGSARITQQAFGCCLGHFSSLCYGLA